MNRTDYEYTPWEDSDDDCTKIWHDFTHKTTGEKINFDYSPYRTPSREVVQAWFDQGCPTRERFFNGRVSHPITDEQLLGK